MATRAGSRERLTSRIAGVALLALSVACSGSRVEWNRGDTLPPEFSLEEIAAACLPEGLRSADRDPARSVAVLGWRMAVLERGRIAPLEVWDCLVWQECRDDDGNERWTLKTLFRHPRSDDVWTWAAVSHSSHEGLRVYESPPGLQDVYDFIYAAFWDLDPPGRHDSAEPGEVRAASLCSEAWLRTIGAAPAVPIPPEDPAARRKRESRSVGTTF